MSWWSRLFGSMPAQAPEDAPARHEPALAPEPTPAPARAAEAAPRVETSAGQAANGHPAIDERARLELRQDSPEFEEFIVRHELDAGDNLPHAAQHLGNLLLVDPSHPRWRELLDRLVAAAGPAVDALVPDTEPRTAATEALRAWIWHRQGRLDDAVDRLVDVARALRGDGLLQAWALDWLEAPGALGRLRQDTGLRLYAALMTFTGEAPHANARQLASVRRWCALLALAWPTWQHTSVLRMARIGMLRKSGRIDEALALAGPLDEAHDYPSVVAIGTALRAQGRLEESARAFEQGAPLETEGVTAWLEAGDSWLAAGRWPEALAAYEAALARQPGQEWAEPSAAFCRWKLEGGDPWTHPVGQALTAGNERARALLFREFGAIGQSGDASAGLLRQMREKWLQAPPTEGHLRLAVNTIEAPSAALAMALELAAFGVAPQVEITYGGVPALDPRRPAADVAYTLWHWDGLRATPAVQALDDEATVLIAGLAAERYEPWDNWAQASHVAARLGPAATADVLAVMVNPPPVPAGGQALDWLPRVQLAAAMVVAQVDSGWEGSRRRAALHSLLLGPMDWTTTAGISALGWVARTEPAHAQDIHRLFEERERQLPTDGHWDWIDRLYAEWQTLPWLFDREREALKARREARQ